MAALDRSRPFAQVYYDDLGRSFTQDDKFFLADGSEWIAPSAEGDGAAKPAKRAKAAAEPASPVDDQLAAQLGGGA